MICLSYHSGIRMSNDVLDMHEKHEVFEWPGQENPNKPAETKVREYAKILEYSTNEEAELWITRLSKLNKGECYAFGPSLNQKTGQLEEKAFRIKITAIEKRVFDNND